jgi:Holliday junction DNA helicase RuvA
MIIYLEGKIRECTEDYAVLLTHGVGYQVYVPKPHLEKLAASQTDVALHIHSIYREDAQQLYGFIDAEEKKLFIQLLQVNSIGPKIALGILSHMGPEQLIDAIRFEDIARLTALPGIGKRSAERLIVELKDKVALQFKLSTKTLNPSHKFFETGKSPSHDAISALINLGYSPQEAEIAVKQIPAATELSLEDLVREGLKVLA